MKIKLFLKPLLKWWWLIVLAGVIAGTTSYLIVRTLPKVYTARTMLMVSTTITDPNPDIYQYGIIYQLTQTYAYIGYQDTVRNATMNALGITKLPDYEVAALSSGPFLEIKVTDTNAEMAARVANELGNQIISISPTNAQQSSEAQTNFFLQQQLADLRDKIEKTQEEIANKQDVLANMTSAGEISQAQSDLTALENKLATYQTTYASLITSTTRSAVNTITVFEPAMIPVYPVGPRIPLVVLASIIGGLLLGILAAILIELLDDSIKDVNEISELMQVPIIGTISQMPKEQGLEFLKDNPDSMIADSFHMLRVNLGFLGVDQPLHTIMVSSPGPGDGKSTVAIYLAYTMATGNKSVVIIDADLRHPKLHTILGKSNEKGLSDLFTEETGLEDVMVGVDDDMIFFIPAGNSPPNPVDLLASKRMGTILEMLKVRFDVIIVDCPPLIVPDASVLSEKVDGILLIVRADHTSRRAIQMARDQLKRARSRILGVVANGVSSQPHYYGSYYQPKKNKKLNKTTQN
jgi:capsular exopolysaccharide synthesis family protein